MPSTSLDVGGSKLPIAGKQPVIGSIGQPIVQTIFSARCLPTLAKKSLNPFAISEIPSLVKLVGILAELLQFLSVNAV